MANRIVLQVRDFVERWKVPAEALLLETEALVVEACHGIISHYVKGAGKLAARFKTEVRMLLNPPASFPCKEPCGCNP